jgi:hypothetical protein
LDLSRIGYSRIIPLKDRSSGFCLFRPNIGYSRNCYYRIDVTTVYVNNLCMYVQIVHETTIRGKLNSAVCSFLLRKKDLISFLHFVIKKKEMSQEHADCRQSRDANF